LPESPGNTRYRQLKSPPTKVKIGVSGCPFCYGESFVWNIDIFGKKKGWTFIIGGSSARRPRIGDILKEDLSKGEVIDLSKRCLQQYKDKAKKKERMARFVKLFNLGQTDRNDAITEIFKSKAILISSPTISRGILVSVAGIFEKIKGLKFKNKKAAAFGCYGWSGESTKIISESLKDAGFEVVDDGIKAMWNPDNENITKCIEYGRQFAVKIL
jgi:flavodoxin